MKDASRMFRWALLAASLVTIAFLLAAAVRENFLAQWYLVQRDYRSLLWSKAADEQGRALARGFRIELKQITVPALGAVDRCASCHNGIDDPRMTDVKQPHRVHPGDVLEHHPADRYGCVVCHQGQGLATNFRDAKAEDAFWDYPLLTKQLTQSSCLTCHDAAHLEQRAPQQVALLRQGMRLYEEKSCASCHKIGGRGGVLGPALDDVGAKTKHQFVLTNLQGSHTTWNWHLQHFRDPAGLVPGSQMINPRVTDPEALALTVYMLALRQRDVPESYLAPDKIEEKYRARLRPSLPGEQAYRSYCSACHLPQGQGGNFASLGVRSPAIGSADFLDVASDQFIASTLRTGRPERKMPAMAAPGATLSEKETGSLIAFLRRRAAGPPSLAAVESARSNRAVGEQLYRADCAACHGNAGQGTPLGSPLAARDRRAASRGALYRATVEGVQDTAMPRYSRYSAAELRSLLDFTASLPLVPELRATWRKGQGDPAAGSLLFAKNCAGCHGEHGQGKIGPALGSAGFQAAATEEFIAATIVRGRAGTPMPAFGRDNMSYPRLTAQEVLNLAAFVRGGLAATSDTKQAAFGRETGPPEAQRK